MSPRVKCAVGAHTPIGLYGSPPPPFHSLLPHLSPLAPVLPSICAFTTFFFCRARHLRGLAQTACTLLAKATKAKGSAQAEPHTNLLAPTNHHRGTGENIPFLNCTFEWGVVITTFLSILSILPRHCARLTDFLRPKLRKMNAVLIPPQQITLPLRSTPYGQG